MDYDKGLVMESREIMFYEIEVAGLKRKLPLFPVNDELQIAAFIILSDVEITEAAAKELLKIAPDFDIIMTAEAKSIPLIYEMAKQAKMNDYIVARKGLKVYMKNHIEAKVDSITTQHTQKLYLGEAEVELIKGKKVLIVDDVISTGESLKALEKLVEKAGGILAGKMAILGEGDAMNREDIKVLGQLPVFNGDGSIKE